MQPNKYNINPVAGKSRLGYKHTLESKTLISIMRKDNTYFSGKTHNEGDKDKLKARISGYRNHRFGKPVTEKNHKLRSKMFSKENYVYNTDNMNLIKVFTLHKDLSIEYNMSSKTMVKYKYTKVPYVIFTWTND